jgi:hypothetical protein
MTMFAIRGGSVGEGLDVTKLEGEPIERERSI